MASLEQDVHLYNTLVKVVVMLRALYSEMDMAKKPTITINKFDFDYFCTKIKMAIPPEEVTTKMMRHDQFEFHGVLFKRGS